MEFKYSPGEGGFRVNINPQKAAKKPRKPIGSKGARIAINLAVTLVVGLVYYYVSLPALNPHAEEFYGFVFLLCAVYCGCALVTSGFQGEGAKGYFHFVWKQCRVPFFLVPINGQFRTFFFECLKNRKDLHRIIRPVCKDTIAEDRREKSCARFPDLDF